MVYSRHFQRNNDATTNRPMRSEGSRDWEATEMMHVTCSTWPLPGKQSSLVIGESDRVLRANNMGTYAAENGSEGVAVKVLYDIPLISLF
jgi:hypothetical protein